MEVDRVLTTIAPGTDWTEVEQTLLGRGFVPFWAARDEQLARWIVCTCGAIERVGAIGMAGPDDEAAVFYVHPACGRWIRIDP